MVLSSAFGSTELHHWSKQSLHLTQNLRPGGNSDTSGEPLGSVDSTKIPDPTLFVFKHQDTGLAETRLPNVAECAAHLELLEAFCALRRKVLDSTTLDRVLGIQARPRTVYRRVAGYRRRPERKAVQLKDTTFAERRKAKWPIFVSIAAARFMHWARVVGGSPGHMEAELLDRSLHLPPLDILMVWHALLLNTEWFRSLKKVNVEVLVKIAFPWKSIHEAINSHSKDWPFTLTAEDQSWVRKHANLWPDLFEGLAAKRSSKVITDLLLQFGSMKSVADRGIWAKQIAEAATNVTAQAKEDQQFLACLELAAKKKGETLNGLVDAVTRQESFAGKMERQLWIRSPGLQGMLHSSQRRYEEFLGLFRLYPRTVLVPTLDIDLVWHTHQCSPDQYHASCMSRAGRLIDHDDKISKEALGPGFERTCELYRMRFAKEYNICQCWDCALMRNFIELREESDEAMIAQLVQAKVGHYRAVEIERRKTRA